jgi:hypothetical protein
VAPGVHAFFQERAAIEKARRAAIRDVITGSLGKPISSVAGEE